MISLRRLRAIARKELIQLLRDKRMLPMIFIAPVVQLTMLGYAASYDLSSVRLGVHDGDRSALSRRLVDAIDASHTFQIRALDSDDALERGLISGDIEAALAIPPDLTRRVESGGRAGVALWLDGSDSNRALAASGQLQAILARESLPLAVHALRDVGAWGALAPPTGSPTGGGTPTEGGTLTPLDPPVAIVPKIRFNPTLESRPFMVPGVLAMVLTIITTILTAMAVVRERERGTIEQIAVSPVRASEWILGKLLPFVGVALADVFLVSGVALFWFHVPLRGSFGLLVFLSGLYITSTLGLGLLISSVSRTQQQAMLTALLVILPINLLSGIFYPISNMPGSMRALSYLMPLRYFGVCLRAVFLKGAGLVALWPEAAAMAGIGLATLAVAIVRSRRAFR